jgi:outer membrane protein TolC
MKKTIIFINLAVVFTMSLQAQTINLEQARTLALANSRSLAKYNLSIQSSILDEKSQLYTMLPSPSAGYSASMTYLNKNWAFENPLDTFGASANFAVTQKIFEGGKSFIQKALSSIATESVRKDALAEYFNVLDSVGSAYYAALEAAASLDSAESSLRTAALSLSIAEIRQASGMINQGDYLKALAEKESRENSRNQARRNVALCMAKLRSLTGLAELPGLEQIDFAMYEEPIRFLAEISDEQADALYFDFLEILANSNPSLAKAALNSRRAEKNLSLAKRDYAPTLNATVFSTGINYSTAGGFGSTAGGGIVLSGKIPLDFWVMNNKIAKSKIAVNSAALDYINVENSLENELQTALLNAFAQAGSVLSSRRSLEYAEKHLEYIMERYRLSQSSVSDLSDASALASSSRAQLIRAQYGFLQSLSKLRSMGAVDDEERLMKILSENAL